MKLIVKVIVIAVGMAAVAIFRFQAQRRAHAQEASGGCLSCGSAQVVSEGQVKRCLACGYEGRADGGGQLSAQEIHAMYDQTPTAEQRERGW